MGWEPFPRGSAHLKKPLQPSQVMALKWKPVALSPQTPQIRGTLRSKSPAGSGRDVLAATVSMSGGAEESSVCVQLSQLYKKQIRCKSRIFWVFFFFARIRLDVTRKALRSSGSAQSHHHRMGSSGSVHPCVWICPVRAARTPPGRAPLQHPAERAHVSLLHFSNKTPTAHCKPRPFLPPHFAFGFQKTSLERTQIHPKQRCKTAGKEVGAGAEPPHAHTGSSAGTQSSSQLRGIPSTDRRSITPKELEGTDGQTEGRKEMGLPVQSTRSWKEHWSRARRGLFSCLLLFSFSPPFSFHFPFFSPFFLSFFPPFLPSHFLKLIIYFKGH